MRPAPAQGSAAPVLFTAVRRFDPETPAALRHDPLEPAERWAKYVAWSGLHQLREVLSLDSFLCPSFFDQLVDEDWAHNVHADFKTDLFRDADHVIRRVGEAPYNVLAIAEEPAPEDVDAFDDPRFAFRGFDLVEEATGISALVNCGGFDRAFLGSELSDRGLLVDHARARTVQALLRAEYPDEMHADCVMWGLWQRE